MGKNRPALFRGRQLPGPDHYSVGSLAGKGRCGRAGRIHSPHLWYRRV